MTVKYDFMHKEDVAAIFSIDRDTGVIQSLDIREKEIMPPRAARSLPEFRNWWTDRAIPKTRHNLRLWLETHGVKDTQGFLLKNLALSLTDCWWVRPTGSGIKWKDVNFYNNDFGVIRKEVEQTATRYTPDASTSGNLPKFWVAEGKERILIKGNEGGTYQQSYNEVFASNLHERQKRFPFVEYRLVSINGKGIGCACKAFTDIDTEFISAWDLFGHDGYRSGEMSRNGFAELLGKLGLDEQECRKNLDYMAVTDFLLANTDRHLNNLGILRDSNTLEIRGLAPIFDTGNSMGFGLEPEMYSILNAKTCGFNSSFRKSLSTVSSMDVVDISQLPSADEIREFYKNSRMAEKDIIRLGTLFANRVQILDGMQRGKSFFDLTKRWHSPSNGIPQGRPQFGQGLSMWYKKQEENRLANKSKSKEDHDKDVK